MFLNVTELSGHSSRFGQRLREAVEIALEQGDEDLLTVDVARLFLDRQTEEMMDAFRRYCVRSVIHFRIFPTLVGVTTKTEHSSQLETGRGFSFVVDVGEGAGIATHLPQGVSTGESSPTPDGSPRVPHGPSSTDNQISASPRTTSASHCAARRRNARSSS